MGLRSVYQDNTKFKGARSRSIRYFVLYPLFGMFV